jgi:hypothetical protein
MRAVLLSALLLLGMSVPAAGALPEEAGFWFDGVFYEYATGRLGSGVILLDNGTGEPEPEPFLGCAFAMLHPRTGNGRVMVKGLFGLATTLHADVEPFFFEDPETGNDTTGYKYDEEVEFEGHDILTDVYVTGNASMRVAASKYYDPVSSTGVSMTDKKAPKLAGQTLITQQGLYDENGTLRPQPLLGDEEMHVRISSKSEASPVGFSYSYTSEGDLPVSDGGTTTPSETFSARHSFDNLKWGGKGTLTVTASALAPPEMNEFTFRVYAPNGSQVGNLSVAPAVGDPDSATLTFPLAELGRYYIAVNGKIALGSYTANVRLDPPPGFDLHLVFDNVTYGYDAYVDYMECKDVTRGPNAPAATDFITKPPEPPQMALEWVLVGIGGAGIAALTGIKLASDQMSLSSFRKAKS